jgi:hypothetical protein
VSEGTGIARWPLMIIAAPAAVAVWSGWVGLGQMCGFGLVQPLPGITSWHLDTAITLPIGIEAYGTYALGAWVKLAGSAGTVAARAASFAKRSSIGALALGMTGQVIYHLLAAAHATRAPWPVIILVACLPVMSLGFGAALIHLSLAAAEEIADQQADKEEKRQARIADRQARTAGSPDKGLAPYGSSGAALAPSGSGLYDTPRTERPQPVRTPPVRGERTGPRPDRAELVERLAAEMLADPGWRPDYKALESETGFGHSWCEKRVKEARAMAEARRTRPGLIRSAS